MIACRSIVTAFIGLNLVAFNATAAETAHVRVPGFHRFYVAPLPKPIDEDEEPVKLDPITGGHILLGELNCFACHAAPESKAFVSAKQAPILDGIGTRIKGDWIRTLLTNPQQAKPGTTMPDLLHSLPEKDRAASIEALTQFLVSTGPLKQEDTDPEKATKGAGLFRKVGCLACHDPVESDAAKLETSVNLPRMSEKYTYPGLVDFLKDPLKWRPSGRMPTFTIPEEDIRLISHYLVRNQPQTPHTSMVKVDKALVEKGRQLFSTIGCASCHTMHIAGELIKAESTSKPLSQCNLEQGCMSAKEGKAPRFALMEQQRTSLKNAIHSNSLESPAESIHRTLATMNCYACHQRDKLGGVEEARSPFFESRQQEMGEEGRLPPTLTGVGDKLRPEWLRQLFNSGTNERTHYLATKMPRFGMKSVERLTDLFATVDSRPDEKPVIQIADPEYRIKAAGRHLVGGQALSCIKCHDFANHASTGVRAINLATMSTRIREDWFYRYVLDPQVYRRGTRMPAAWPYGRATIRDVLSADANQQIQAVWMYLSDGDRGSPPPGIVREAMELKPTSEPIIYRNFIEGAGSRAIAVGYPEKVSLAFDAEQLRLALIWRGAFIDASRHWTGRGKGFEPPLGDDVIPLPTGHPLQVLDQLSEPFTAPQTDASSNRFHGYSLNEKQQPTFRYSFNGIQIEDTPIPITNNDQPTALKRTLKFTGQGGTDRLWYLAARSNRIRETDRGRYRIDDAWGMEIQSTAHEKSVVREIQGKQELLVPIRLIDGQAEVTQTYLW